MSDNYFMQMASIAATLLGLSFLALTFFLGGLEVRYKGLSLPVFLHEVRRTLKHSKAASTSDEPLPSQITDLQLFDSDPVVVFLAFSISVTWNLYFLALILSLTLLDSQLDTPWLIAGELIAFWGIIGYSIIVRHRRYRMLDTYRTGEERLWEFGECVTLLALTGVMALSVVVALLDSCGSNAVGVCGAAVQESTRTNLDIAFHYALKGVTLGAICLGLYVTNKDLFVFFKARTSDDIRKRWIESFMGEGYGSLTRRVDSVLSSNGIDSEAGRLLASKWNHGCPDSTYIRQGYRPSGFGAKTVSDPYWLLLQRRSPTVASWMFDVPGIATWVSDIETLLQEQSAPESDETFD